MERRIDKGREGEIERERERKREKEGEREKGLQGYGSDKLKGTERG